MTACVMFGVYVTISRKGIGGNSKNMLDGEKEQHILYTLKADMKKGDKVSDEDLEHHVISVDREDNIKFPDKQDILGKEIKIDVSKGALIDKDIILTDEKADDSLRLQMYSGIELNPEVLEGSIVDIRIHFADGEDYVVASYKRVEKRGEDSIFVFVDEEEILRLSSAETDRNMYAGTKLYAITYVHDYQQPARPDYPVNGYVSELYDWTPNILKSVFTEDMLERRQLLEENLRQLVQ